MHLMRILVLLSHKPHVPLSAFASLEVHASSFCQRFGWVGGAWVVGDTLQWQSDVYQSGKTALTARRAAECWQYRRTHTHVYYTAGYPSCVHKQRLDMERTDASLL